MAPIEIQNKFYSALDQNDEWGVAETLDMGMEISSIDLDFIAAKDMSNVLETLLASGMAVEKKTIPGCFTSGAWNTLGYLVEYYGKSGNLEMLNEILKASADHGVDRWRCEYIEEQAIKYGGVQTSA